MISAKSTDKQIAQFILNLPDERIPQILIAITEGLNAKAQRLAADLKLLCSSGGPSA